MEISSLNAQEKLAYIVVCGPYSYLFFQNSSLELKIILQTDGRIYYIFRKTEHPVWEFFKRTNDGNAQCTICTGIGMDFAIIISYLPRSITVKSPCSSNFMRHLMRHHAEQYNNVYLKWIQKRTATK